jgi:glycosyltransferase involved in cell wall biosynthesis
MKILLLSTRYGGWDGLSLEIANWERVFRLMGHRVEVLAGEVHGSAHKDRLLDFNDREAAWFFQTAFLKRSAPPLDYFRKLEEMAERVERSLIHWVNGKQFDLVVTMNTLSLPVHLPFGLALARFIQRYHWPLLVRHLDFWFEQERYRDTWVEPLLEGYFPPRIDGVTHLVINSLAQTELRRRWGIQAEICPDSFDFDRVPLLDDRQHHLRSELGLTDRDILILQATRLIPRKNAEASIEFVRQLNDPRAVLVLTGTPHDDFTTAYFKQINRLAKKAEIRYRFVWPKIASNGSDRIQKNSYKLWDFYLQADWLIYPSTWEGFGNQFVEGVAFQKPLLIYPYPVYQADIASRGFQVILLDDLTKAVDEFRNLNRNQAALATMVKQNYQLGQRFYSSAALADRLRSILEKVIIKNDRVRKTPEPAYL